MKARHIRKLRKEIATFTQFKVRESCGAFGDFFGNNRLCLVLDTYAITAKTPIQAVERFARYFRRRFHRLPDQYRKDMIETTKDWGHIMVVDNKGYQYFFM